MTEWTEAEKLIVEWRRERAGLFPLGSASRLLADFADKLLDECKPTLLDAEEASEIFDAGPNRADECFALVVDAAHARALAVLEHAARPIDGSKPVAPEHTLISLATIRSVLDRS